MAAAVIWGSGGAAQAQVRTEGGQRYASLLVGQAILQVCGARLTPASAAKLDAELARRRAAQSELSDATVATMDGKLRADLGAPANRDRVCGQLAQTGADAYVDLIVSQR